MNKNNIIPIESITDRIFEIRNQKVMVDRDLATLYNVATKALNQAVKRNLARFPEDFMFKLTKNERNELVTNCDRLSKLKYSSVMPNVFTESGVAMLASVLNSEQAALINVQIIRAFVHLRQMLLENDALRYAVEGLERRVTKNERSIQVAINTLQQLISSPEPKKKKKMGFGKY